MSRVQGVRSAASSQVVTTDAEDAAGGHADGRAAGGGHVETVTDIAHTWPNPSANNSAFQVGGNKLESVLIGEQRPHLGQAPARQ